MKKKNVWNDEELNHLRQACLEVKSLSELKKKVDNIFPNHSWSSLVKEVYQHPDWTSHFSRKVGLMKKKETDESMPGETGEGEADANSVGSESMDANADALLKILLKGSSDITEISEKLNVAKETVWLIIDKLRDRGYEVIEDNRRVYLKREPEAGRVVKLPGSAQSTVKIMVLSDLGLGLKAQQPDLLATAYKVAEEEGVYFALAMDVSAGAVRADRDSEHVNELGSFEAQVEYVVGNFPKASFNTYFLNGPRDLSHMTKKNPQNFAMTIGEIRDDLRYLGDIQAILEVREARIALNHANAASIYTKSYPLQGIIENFQEAIGYVFNGEENPDIVLVGGLYSAFETPRRLPLSKDRRNDIHGFAIPGLHTITASQAVRKRRGGSPVLGFLILTLEFGRDGSLKRVVPDWRDLTAYRKRRNYLADIEFVPDLSDEEKKILESLEQDPRTRGDLSRKLNKSIPYVEEMIEKLKERGYAIIFAQAEKRYKLLRSIRTKFEPLVFDQKNIRTARVVAASDPHLGCVHERPDLVREVYRIAEERGAQKVLWPGDIFEGEGAYKGQARELIHHGADAQRNHGLEVFPNSKIPSEFIMGSSHELAFWERCGHNVVETFCAMGRSRGKKFKYIGLPNRGNKGLTKVNGIGFQLIHPKGGIPYGISYRLQNRIEKLVTIIEKDSEEKILLCGHLHIAAFMIYKGIVGFMVPCLEEETGYLVGSGYIPFLGVWVIDVAQDKAGNVIRVVPEYIPFAPSH